MTVGLLVGAVETTEVAGEAVASVRTVATVAPKTLPTSRSGVSNDVESSDHLR